MKPYEIRRALPRKCITVTLELTPEEYDALVTAVIRKRQEAQDQLPPDSPWRCEVIERTSPLAHLAVESDVGSKLIAAVISYIGHEGRPTLEAQYARMHAEIQAEAQTLEHKELARVA